MRSAVALGLTGLLAGCAGARVHEAGPGAASWPPLSPATLGAERAANQRLRAAFSDREVSVDCVVKVSAGHLTVIGLVPGGPRMFSVDFDGQQVSTQKSADMPGDLEPQLLLDDLQLTLWPLPALQRALAHSRWTVSEPDERTRRLARDRKLIAEVHYASSDPWSGRTWLVNFERGYSITIDSVALE